MSRPEWYVVENGTAAQRYQVRNWRTGYMLFADTTKHEVAEQFAALLNRMVPPAWGIKFSWRAAWVGVHHSKYNKRTCINVVPFITLWITGTGGVKP